MSIGKTSLILALLLSAVFQSSAQTGPYLESDRTTTQVTSKRDAGYNPKYNIQPADSCQGDVGAIADSARKAFGNLPSKWTHPDTGRDDVFNVTVLGLNRLDQDRPFLAFCRDTVLTVKYSLSTRDLEVRVHYDFLEIDHATFRVDYLRAEVEYQDYGVTVGSDRRPDVEVHVEISELGSISLADHGSRSDVALKERIFFALYDVAQGLFRLLFQDALRYNLRDMLGGLRYEPPWLNKEHTSP